MYFLLNIIINTILVVKENPILFREIIKKKSLTPKALLY